MSCARVTGAGNSQVTSARENASARRSEPNSQVYARMSVTPTAARSSMIAGLTSGDPLGDGRWRTATAQR